MVRVAKTARGTTAKQMAARRTDDKRQGGAQEAALEDTVTQQPRRH